MKKLFVACAFSVLTALGITPTGAEENRPGTGSAAEGDEDLLRAKISAAAGMDRRIVARIAQGASARNLPAGHRGSLTAVCILLGRPNDFHTDEFKWKVGPQPGRMIRHLMGSGRPPVPYASMIWAEDIVRLDTVPQGDGLRGTAHFD